MERSYFSRVNVVVFAGSGHTQKSVLEALALQGFTTTVLIDSVDRLNDAIQSRSIDLLISASASGSVFLGNTVRDIRHGHHGKHPFPIVLMIAQSPEAQHVQAIINAGVDDLLLEPLSVERVVKRVSPFVAERRPFVVTYDYIGPDRRTGNRADASSAPLLQVPNPVRLKVAGTDNEKCQEMLRDATLFVNQYKIERNGVQLSWLIDRLGEELHLPTRSQNELFALLQRIDETACDVFRRAEHRSEEPFRERARIVSSNAREICLSGDIAADPRLAGMMRHAGEFANALTSAFAA